MKGIDVSYVQKNIDWAKVKEAGIEFAFMRIGYGREVSQKDAMFESHYSGAKGVNMLIGGYHYSYAMNTEGAMQEAKACLAMLGDKTFDLPIAYDMEEAKQFALSPDTLYSIYKTFAGILEANGYKCMLYTNKNWMTNKWDKTTIAADGIPIWMAQYNRIMTYSGPSKISIWQNSSSSNIAGISGRVDTNVLLCDIAELIGEKARWYQENGFWRYRRMDKTEPIGWEKIDGKWYYFNDAGYMVTGWILYDEQWYYLKESGTMASDEILTICSETYGEEKYMFGTDGHMMKVNARGALY